MLARNVRTIFLKGLQMTMQRRHFQFIADALRETRPDDDSHSSVMLQWDQTVRTMAIKLERTNAQFNSSRFIEACGGLHGAV